MGYELFNLSKTKATAQQTANYFKSRGDDAIVRKVVDVKGGRPMGNWAVFKFYEGHGRFALAKKQR